MRYQRKPTPVFVALLGAFLLLSFAWIEPALSSTYYVSPGGHDDTGDGTEGNPWRSIGKAVFVASPINNDIIEVISDETPATDDYIENVVVDKPVTIRSYSGNTNPPWVKANDYAEHVFSVTSDGVTIHALEIYGAATTGKAGIYLNNVSGCTISQNACGWDSTTYWNMIGILVNGGSGNQIWYNSCSYNGTGVSIQGGSQGNTISNNSIQYNSTGIAVVLGSNNIISGNNVLGSSLTGVEIGASCQGNELAGNTIQNWEREVFFGASGNRCYFNSFQNYIEASVSGNVFQTPTKLGYWYDSELRKGLMGNYYNDYGGTDSDGDGIGDMPYLGGNWIDDYPLIGMANPEIYTLDAWFLSNPVMYKGDMSKIGAAVTIAAESSQVWADDSPMGEARNFGAGVAADQTTWTGRIAFAEAPAANDQFTVDIGYADNSAGANFQAMGPQATLTGDTNTSLFSFTASPQAFIVPAGKHLAVRITGASANSGSFDVRVGGSWSYISAPVEASSGATVSGTVYLSGRTPPYTGIEITVHAYTGDPCTESHQWQGSADIIQADGTYTIQGLPAGNDYYLETYTEAAYLNEYWAQDSSSPHCGSAESFDLTEGDTFGGKNFQLDREATISGTIFHSDGTTPLTETTVWVNVYSGDPCGDKEWIASACTNPPGASYTVGKLVAGTYYLETGGQETYPNEWWAGPNSSPDCQDAIAITLYEGDTPENKDFQLDGPTITSFTPTSGGKGTVVVITGTNFTDATAVKFGGTNATITFNSATQITATVGTGATGKVTVTTDGGTGTSAGDFTYNAVYPSVYWIDIQNGSDNNNGRQETPWGTIHNGLLQINGGSAGTAASQYTLIVKIGGGTHYSRGTGEPDSELVVSQDYVRIIGESGSGPIIDGTGAQMWTKGLTIEGSHVSVDNLYITNFSADGGMGIEFNSGSDNIVENCKLYGNNEGVNFGSTTSGNTLRNCDIYHNNKGVVCYSSNKIIQNTIHGNENDGVFVDNASPEIDRNAIYDNTFNLSITAGNQETASPVIRNNLIYETSTDAVHYGIYVGGNAGSTVTPEIYHNTIDRGKYEGILIEGDNDAPIIKYNIITNFRQYGIQQSYPTQEPVIDYNDVWNNATANYSGCSAGDHGISADPKYGSYTLRSDSPCIDKIPKSTPPSPPDDPVVIDYEGHKRPRGAGYDMGAYEYVAPVTFNYTLPGGTGLATDYRIFTVPLDLGKGSTLLSQMEAVLSNYDPFHWRGFAYQGTSYLEFNSSGFADLDIKPGRGYWIISLYTDVIPFTGMPAPDGIDYRMVLSPGWHLIGLPWIDKKISLGNIYVSDRINRYPITSQPTGMELTQEFVWEYTGASGYAQRNSATYQLECGTGYWIKVLADHLVTLIIPFENQAPEGPGHTVPEDLSSPSVSGEEPPPPPGAEPIPGVTFNRPAGSMTAVSGTPVSVAVTLDPGAWAGRDADWWMAAHTPFAAPYDWYSYVHPTGWRPGIHRCVKAPLFEIARPFEVLNMNLPAGRYTFYFAVDGNADGKLDITWIDSVDVTVE